MDRKLREVILPLYFAFVRIPSPVLQFWGPQHKPDMDLLEWVQRRPQKLSEGWNPSAVRTG